MNSIRWLMTAAVSVAVIASGRAASGGDPALAEPGFSVQHMDRSVAPGTDFAKFAAGGWYARTQIPADKSRWGGFNELNERNWAALRVILEDAAANPGEAGSLKRKVGDFFASAMDVARLKALGVKPIAADLEAIAKADSVAALLKLAARQHIALGNPFFGIAFYADQKKSDTYGFYLSQGGMSLPSKEYYFSDKFARERWEFIGHVARMLELAGESKAAAYKNAEVIFNLEKALAENAKLPVDLRDRLANYHKMTIAEAASAYPGLPLKQFTGDIGLPSSVSEVIIGQPKFFESLSKLLQERPLDELKTYARWTLLTAAAPFLSEDFDRENFRFFSTVLSGTPEQEPRWRRAGTVVDGRIGEALGQLYVAKHFPPESKARMMEMIGNLKIVMRERLQKVEWMSEETRQKALAKFDRFSPMIGYTEKWRDYSGVEIKRDDYFGNVMRATIAEARRQIDRTGQKVDKREWSMTPPTVNAYFSPTQNQIVFPAGILQPPFFDPKLDDAVNYGAIGGVIGHEITHGFDDQGRRFDAEGNLTDWWTPEDATRFRERAQKVVEQYNQYQALPGLSVNGQLSLGENIADLGGTSIAFEAYQRSLKGKPTPPKTDGFTAEQRFFLGWAQMWRTQYREDAMRLQVARGPHAPGNFRAVGPLVNHPAFFEVFGIKEGEPMWRSPENRAKIW